MFLGNQDHPLVTFDGHVAANPQAFENPNPLPNKQTAIIFFILGINKFRLRSWFQCTPLISRPLFSS